MVDIKMCQDNDVMYIVFFQMWWKIVQRLNGLPLVHILKTGKIGCCLDNKEDRGRHNEQLRIMEPLIK